MIILLHRRIFLQGFVYGGSYSSFVYLCFKKILEGLIPKRDFSTQLF